MSMEWQHLSNGDTTIRDSKQGDGGPVLHFDRHEIAAWVEAVKTGEFMAEANGKAVPAALAEKG